MFPNTFLLINQISVKKLPVQDMYIKYIACPAVFLVFLSDQLPPCAVQPFRSIVGNTIEKYASLALLL